MWPAEWSPQSGCILLLPHNSYTFCLARALPQCVAIVQAIAQHEPVHVLVHPDTATEMIPDFGSSSNVTIHTVVTDDTWARDTAPTFIIGDDENDDDDKDQKLIALDWDFNGYGGPNDGCYWPCDNDRALAGRIAALWNMETRKIPLILEGGAIHTDGQGTILTTEECLLNPNRNPHLTKQQIEDLVLQATNCSKMIWLPHGLAYDDDTNGHIDNFCCFVAPTVLVLAWTDDEENDTENYQRCRQALSILESQTDAQGRTLTVHKLYLPSPVRYTQDDIDGLYSQTKKEEDGTVPTAQRTVGERMAASYINFFICNGAVIVPQFGDVIYDRQAIDTLQPLFPTRSVMGVNSREILVGGGNIHCITQQIPKVGN